MIRAVALALATLLAAPAAAAPLPVIGPAPEFALTGAHGERVSSAALRGKVVALTFVFTTCSDACPTLTAKLAEIRRRLGPDFGPRVRFVSISVDPLTDTPERLKRYAAAFDADVDGWSFATGTPQQIDEVVRRFGAYARKNDAGSIDHLFLTSLIDRAGRIRLQYLGTRFDAGEMLSDLKLLLRE